MVKRGIGVLMASALLIGSLCACGGQPDKSDSVQVNATAEDDGVVDNSAAEDDEAIDANTPEESNAPEQNESDDEESDGEGDGLYAGDIEIKVRETDVTPGVAPYTVEADLSNVDNLWQFYLLDEVQEKLVQNGFVVCGEAGNEFFEVYEYNRYDQIASFVTVDSLMHTYHLYFVYLQKRIEKNYLTDQVTQLSKRMLDDSISEYEDLKGSEWEDAAKRNVAFFNIGLKLLDENTEVNDDVKDTVEYELNHIDKAALIDESAITGVFEDYTQYVPRGYYEGDEELERYFRAMMWFGRIHFKQDDEELDRSALLIAKMLSEDTEAYELWESIYDVTAYFAGASDDNGVNEYIPILNEANENGVTTNDLLTDKNLFARLHKATGELPLPQINSIPIMDGEDKVIPGFRFMGQRFTIDASIMQKLIYSDVKENSKKDKRMLPDVLDVPAALGSDIALDILEENGATDYKRYSENMNKLRKALSVENETLWSASLYAGWLNTLRPLLDVKGEGYPVFMQGEEWAKKDLECFAGSFTELKHDTVLYTKQVMAEMGGGWSEEPDDRGYVEPEPLVYARFADLSDQTALGLQKYGMLTVNDQENLSRLSQMADTFLEISKKELLDETLTEDEYEFIRSYGGNIEHFWMEAVRDKSNGDEEITTRECPAALVVDIATDPNGSVLEVGTSSPSQIYVLVKVDGKVKIAKGSVYSFYQFVWPMDDRLTNTRWHQMMGIKPNGDGNYERDQSITKPEWTASYRYKYEWE